MKDEFGKAMAKGMAEYEKAETEAFDIRKRGGWLGLERHFTGPQFRSFLEISSQAQYQPGVDQHAPAKSNKKTTFPAFRRCRRIENNQQQT